MQIIVIFIVFSLMLFLHELGHYLAAKAFKVPVDEFGFGFPPRLIKLFNVNETEVTLNWIPFGAFVKIRGETETGIPDGLSAVSPWKRLIVFSAGPAMNILMGVIVYFVLFTQVGINIPDKVMINEISPGSPAESAGLSKNDIIISINGEPIKSMDQMIAQVQANGNAIATFDILRNDQKLRFEVIPAYNEELDSWKIGATITNPKQKLPLLNSLGTSFYAVYEQARQMLLIPVMLIRGEVSGTDVRFGGPVMVFGLLNQAVKVDMEANATNQTSFPEATLSIIGVITVALGLTNLLPIPALDGGRILFLLPEILLRKRIPQNYENLVHTIGFFLLIGLLIIVSIQDVINPVKIP